jgi:hypothetical protein
MCPSYEMSNPFYDEWLANRPKEPIYVRDSDLMSVIQEHENFMGTTDVPIFVWDKVDEVVSDRTLNPMRRRTCHCEGRTFDSMEDMLLHLEWNRIVVRSARKLDHDYKKEIHLNYYIID